MNEEAKFPHNPGPGLARMPDPRKTVRIGWPSMDCRLRETTDMIR